MFDINKTLVLAIDLQEKLVSAAGAFDEVQNAVTAGLSSTIAMKDSTETAQF